MPLHSPEPIEILEGMYGRKLMLNDWIHEAVRPHAVRIIPDESRYTFVFDTLEILMALSYAYKDDQTSGQYWAPLGGFALRRDNRVQVFKEIEESLSTMHDKSPFVTSGIFGETAEECKKGLADLRKFLPTVGWRR